MLHVLHRALNAVNVLRQHAAGLTAVAVDILESDAVGFVF